VTVILVDPRRPSLVPVEAIELLSGEVQYTEEMPVAVPWTLPAARPAHSGDDAPVLLSSDAEHPAVTARLAAGERLISAPGHQPGERLVDAVAMMDKLRTAGPWESEQTHDSLRRFLLEETYEVFDAVRSGDADALREELGDVLLQVLFHARIAEDAPQPLGARRVGERDLGGRLVDWIVDGPGQDRATDFQHRDERRRCDEFACRTGAPKTGIGNQSHPATCNSSIALIRCRWSRLTDRATPSSSERTSSTSAHGSCQTSRPCSRAHNRLR